MIQSVLCLSRLCDGHFQKNRTQWKNIKFRQNEFYLFYIQNTIQQHSVLANVLSLWYFLYFINSPRQACNNPCKRIKQCRNTFITKWQHKPDSELLNSMYGHSIKRQTFWDLCNLIPVSLLQSVMRPITIILSDPDTSGFQIRGKMQSQYLLIEIWI